MNVKSIKWALCLLCCFYLSQLRPLGKVYANCRRIDKALFHYGPQQNQLRSSAEKNFSNKAELHYYKSLVSTVLPVVKCHVLKTLPISVIDW
jgi:hypothetical protein